MVAGSEDVSVRAQDAKLLRSQNNMRVGAVEEGEAFTTRVHLVVTPLLPKELPQGIGVQVERLEQRRGAEKC